MPHRASRGSRRSASGEELADEYNATRPRQTAERERLLRELFGSIGERVWVEPPLHVAYGNRVHVADDVYVNFNLTLVDDVEVYIGSRVMLAPNVTITTTGHPVHPDLRRDGSQFSAPVRIEDDVWISARRCAAAGRRDRRGIRGGAASVVTGDVPPGVVVAGSPARIIREITDADRDWTYRPPRDLA